MKIKIILVSFIIFIIIFLAAGCIENHNQEKGKVENEKMILDLSGRWKFSLGDDPDWKKTKFNDDDWEKINVPSSWENQGFHGYDGYAWYRTTFKLSPEQMNEQLYLVLGYIDDADQTYLNGNLIGITGGFPPQYRTAYNAFRKYYIPNEFLNPDGENVIAVRVFDAELEGGIMSGKTGIYTSENSMELDVNLSGVWDFRPGDDSLFLKKDAVGFHTFKLMVPAHWDIQGFQDYDGFGWYKKTFLLPEEYNGKNMILMLGKIDDIDQTFVNGILVGSTGLWNFTDIPNEFNKNDEYRINRVYSIPAKILKPGKVNTVAVRVYDGFRDGGIYDGPVGLITQQNYQKYIGRE